MFDLRIVSCLIELRAVCSLFGEFVRCLVKFRAVKSLLGE